MVRSGTSRRRRDRGGSGGRAFVASLLLVLVLLVLAVRLPLHWRDESRRRAFLDPVGRVYAAVMAHFYELPDSAALRRGAIDGLIGALEDPYTEFIPAAGVAEFDKQIRGEFVGIGAEVRSEGGYLLIVSPLDDSPALRAGLRAEDLVLGIDGRSVFGMPVDAIIARLTGEPGTVVRVTVQRDAEAALPEGALPAGEVLSAEGDVEAGGVMVGSEPPALPAGSVRFDLEITRERIRTETVRGLVRDGADWEFLVDPDAGIAYIRVTQFTDTTAPRLREFCERLFVEGDARALVLDLRFNAGGSLLAAVESADLFLSEGTIVSTVGRTTREELVVASRGGTLPEFPMVVLVNSESASASEVLAGALSENGRAKVLGERTFGKGLVQAIYQLPEGLGQLKITEQFYALPSGRIIHRRDDATAWGVDPSPGFYVPMDDESDRVALQRRLEAEVLRSGGRSGERAGDDDGWGDPEWILEHLADAQLSAAVRALRARLGTGEWAPPGGDQPEGVAVGAALREEERRLGVLLRELERTERRLRALAGEGGDEGDGGERGFVVPAGALLDGGTLEIRSADGALIARVRITSDALRNWLVDAPVERIDEEDLNGTAGSPEE
ncbi:MAG: S41 family peptidase [Phycisphaerales bacterium]